MKLDKVIPSKATKGNSKTILFIKLRACTLTMTNIQSDMVISEVGGSSPFEHLELLANEVFLPILSNPNNQNKWGEMPTRELMDRFHDFLSSTTILCGQIKGETRLPMPPMDFTIATTGVAAGGKNKISLLEGNN